MYILISIYFLIFVAVYVLIDKTRQTQFHAKRKIKRSLVNILDDEHDKKAKTNTDKIMSTDNFLSHLESKFTVNLSDAIWFILSALFQQGNDFVQQVRARTMVIF